MKWLVLWSLWASRLLHQPTPTVETKEGKLRGFVATDGSHYRYLGIPYARAEKRFQPSKPSPPWKGVFDAYNGHVRCAQRFTKTIVLGEEDCLTLNVYTPPYKPAKPIPVMVFIHGGGFRDGSGTPFIYGPKYLVQHGIILVTFNYRVEVLGFLCLGIEEAPGNVGLKDQVEALKWVQRNIESFGGDPNQVTLFGESAGSASVMYHMLSPMSKGLFHRAIMQSGSAMAPWSHQFEPLKTASLLAKQFGYSTKDPYEIYNLFKNIPAEDLLKHRVPRKKGDIVLSENIFVPCVEKEISGTEPFLLDSPYNLMVSGNYSKIPLIIGFNSAEGYMFTGKENDTTIADFNFYSALPRDLSILNETDKIETATVIEGMYMGGSKVSKGNLERFSRFEGDSSITYPVIATSELLLKTSNEPVYIYKFDYDGLLNFAKKLYGFGNSPGATHADELFYLFSLKIPTWAYFEREFIYTFTSLWTNFVKYGDPTPDSKILPKWERAKREDPKLYYINKHHSMQNVWDSDVLLYWNTTYSKYRRKQ